MKTISIDIETYSSVNLTKSGVYKYCESDDFAILLFAPQPVNENQRNSLQSCTQYLNRMPRMLYHCSSSSEEVSQASAISLI